MALNNKNFLFLFVFLIFNINFAVSSEFVPVYLWQTSKSDENIPALSRLSTDNFKELIHNQLNKDTILVTFAEPNLSPEDFNAVTQSGERVFNNLANVKDDFNSVYIPQVQTPLSAVSKLFNEDITTVSPENFKTETIQTSAIIIDLNDVQDDEDRNHMLARHDKIIVDIYNQLSKKYTNVVALLTGKQASWIAPEEILSRKVRETATGSAWTARDPNFMFLAYATEPPKWNNAAIDGTPVVGTTFDTNSKTLTATITVGAIVINFQFGFDPNLDQGAYWYFKNVSVTDGGSPVSLSLPKKLYPPRKFSYQCTNQVFEFVDKENPANSRKLVFKNLQIQPFQTRQENSLAFGDPYFCVGFTSPAIWSGLFITFLLATIMAIGLLMMMDMKTMDRFDDPKGKTIVVNVSE